MIRPRIRSRSSRDTILNFSELGMVSPSSDATAHPAGYHAARFPAPPSKPRERDDRGHPRFPGVTNWVVPSHRPSDGVPRLTGFTLQPNLNRKVPGLVESDDGRSYPVPQMVE